MHYSPYCCNSYTVYCCLMVIAEYVKKSQLNIGDVVGTRQLVPSDVEFYQTPKENSLWFTGFRFVSFVILCLFGVYLLVFNNIIIILYLYVRYNVGVSLEQANYAFILGMLNVFGERINQINTLF